jgi:hypothetical protein
MSTICPTEALVIDGSLLLGIQDYLKVLGTLPIITRPLALPASSDPTHQTFPEITAHKLTSNQLISTQVHKYKSNQVYKCTQTKAHKYVSIQIYKYTSTN